MDEKYLHEMLMKIWDIQSDYAFNIPKQKTASIAILKQIYLDGCKAQTKVDMETITEYQNSFTLKYDLLKSLKSAQIKEV